MRERCAAQRLYSACLDPSTLICLAASSLTLLCLIFLEDPTPTHFCLTSSTLFLSLSISLPVSFVPGKVIGKVFSVVELKVAMTKG